MFGSLLCRPKNVNQLSLYKWFQMSLGSIVQVSGAGSVCQPGTRTYSLLCTNLKMI
jgi:hypothetical protein